jgi:hypothetical protein
MTTATSITETPAEQRMRILTKARDTEAWEYDLAVALGYQPESWDGLWSLPVHPFGLERGKITVTQVVMDENHKTQLDGDERFLTRTIRHRLPKGWSIDEHSSPVRFNPPRD